MTYPPSFTDAAVDEAVAVAIALALEIEPLPPAQETGANTLSPWALLGRLAQLDRMPKR